MTWASGECRPTPGGYQIVVTDAYGEPVWISDADVRADLDGELLLLASTERHMVHGEPDPGCPACGRGASEPTP